MKRNNAAVKNVSNYNYGLLRRVEYTYYPKFSLLYLLSVGPFEYTKYPRDLNTLKILKTSLLSQVVETRGIALKLYTF
jgi:hypothetical protein